MQGTKCIVEEQKALDMKWLMVRRPTQACQQLIRRTFTWDFTERPSARTVLLDCWMLDQFVSANQAPHPVTQPCPGHPGPGPYPDPSAPPALPVGLHLHNVGDWAVPATGKWQASAYLTLSHTLRTYRANVVLEKYFLHSTSFLLCHFSIGLRYSAEFTIHV